MACSNPIATTHAGAVRASSPAQASAAASVLLTRSWMVLAIAAFATATACAAVMGALRLAAPRGSADSFATALVLHVNFSTLVWFLTCAAALFSIAGGANATRAGWAALGLTASGAAAMLIAPLFGAAKPILSNYVPVLDAPLFLAGLAWLGCGYTLAVALGCLRRAGDAPPCLRSGLRWAAVAAGAALATILTSLVATPGVAPLQAHYELLFWPIGHALQFVHVLMLITCWAWLAGSAGAVMPRALFLSALAATLLPALVIPAIPLLGGAHGVGPRSVYTDLMTWGSWPGPVMIVAWALVALARGRLSRHGAEGMALGLSMTLFVVGLCLGVAIRGDTTMVPAHYHATIGAVTVAFMGASVLVLPVAGGRAPSPRVVRWQLVTYALGLATLIAGLALSGAGGAARKGATYAAAAGTAPDAWVVALCTAGTGIGVLGAVGYVAWSLLALFARRAPAARLQSGLREGTRHDRRLRAVAITTSLVLALGALIAWLPDSGPGTPSAAPIDSSRHAAQARRDEIEARFKQGVVMLHAKRYDHALTALHRVLELAPDLPEAHVNLGFALLGLQRYGAARDFFESASVLRPQQTNAYYGLAVALEALDDVDAAIGAMRTYLHLAPRDDPYARKAAAALWEWESARAAAIAKPSK